MIVALWFGILGWTFSWALVDGEHILKQEYIKNHASRFFNRAIVGIMLGLLSWKAGVMAALLYWATFDAMLNLYRKKPIFYTGTVANTDKFFKGKRGLYIVTKVLAFAGSVILIFL